MYSSNPCTLNSPIRKISSFACPIAMDGDCSIKCTIKCFGLYSIVTSSPGINFVTKYAQAPIKGN